MKAEKKQINIINYFQLQLYKMHIGKIVLPPRNSWMDKRMPCIAYNALAPHLDIVTLAEQTIKEKN